MFNKFAQLDPRTVKIIKVTTVVVAVAAGAFVAAAIAYKMGLIPDLNAVEEITGAAVEAA